MLQLASRLAQFHLSSGPSQASAGREEKKQQPTLTLQDCIQHLRNVSGLKKENVFCNLRVPNQFQTARDEINIVIVTGHGVFCIDVKSWNGTVSAQKQNWHVQVREEDQNFASTSIEQVPDPLLTITTKAFNLWNHMKRCGVRVRQSLFLPRVLFLSPDCHLDDELKKKKELVSYGDLQVFLHSFQEGYVSWISDALTPAWVTGHLSYRQIGEVQEVLKRMGTWDLVKLHCGDQLKGDYKGCQHIALNRQETDMLEFCRSRTLSTETLWALLGHTPQVTVKMYRRGVQGWLGKPLTGTATIPSNTHVVFRINGEDTDAKIPAHTIHTITLSI